MLRYGTMAIIALCAVVLIILLARHVTVVRFLMANGGDAIHKNVYINGIAVGGMLPEEANAALQKSAGLDRQMIGFVYNDSLVHSFSFADFGAEYDFTALIQEAFLYGRTGSRRERYAQLQALDQVPHEITGTPLYRYDEAAMPERLEMVRAQASIPPTNATMRQEGHGFVVTEGKPGRTPDMQKAADQLRQILAGQQFGGQVVLEMHTVQPAYTVEHFAQAQSVLGSFSTAYTGGEEIPRSINIRLAASLINNTVVFPGEVFSAREVVGPCTPEQGYAMSAVIRDGRLVEDYGGGVCQVVSTLYNAILYAELAVVERANHSLKIHYLDFGFDAAIAGDYMDLKFRNNTRYPVLVAASAQDSHLEIRIYGHETRPANRTLAFVSELIEVIPPQPERVVIDENLPTGHVLVSTEPQNGYKYELFRIVFIDGAQVERERVNTSIYRPIQGVITKGP
ncbi:MAG: VanW family protein [Defluviitaleaceae bacterium]|nr:VanW family protein [Defluviitaleaceae bacterium]